jgi:hypothetical protein
MIVPFDHSGPSASHDISQIQIARIRTTAALFSALAKESTKDAGDEG